MGKAKTSDRTRDIRCVAKLLRDGGYSYDQSKHLIAEARRRVGLTPPQRKKGSVDRFTREELEALLSAAYATSGIRGLLIRSLLETGSRVGAFCQLCVEDISLAELEVRVRDKGGKTRDVPVLQSLANELRIRGLHKQRIYQADSQRDYGALQAMLDRRDSTLHLDWIADQWDRMAQFFCSMATGLVETGSA